jgi:hypothetical protein
VEGSSEYIKDPTELYVESCNRLQVSPAENYIMNAMFIYRPELVSNLLLDFVQSVGLMEKCRYYTYPWYLLRKWQARPLPR